MSPRRPPPLHTLLPIAAGVALAAACVFVLLPALRVRETQDRLESEAARLRLALDESTRARSAIELQVRTLRDEIAARGENDRARTAPETSPGLPPADLIAAAVVDIDARLVSLESAGARGSGPDDAGVRAVIHTDFAGSLRLLEILRRRAPDATLRSLTVRSNTAAAAPGAEPEASPPPPVELALQVEPGP